LGSFGFEFFVGDVILGVCLGFFWLTSSGPGTNLKGQFFASFFKKKTGKNPHLQSS